MKKENKTTFFLYIAASACFFISAFFSFIGSGHINIAYLGLGICFLCLAFSVRKKNKQEDDTER